MFTCMRVFLENKLQKGRYVFCITVIVFDSVTTSPLQHGHCDWLPYVQSFLPSQSWLSCASCHRLFKELAEDSVMVMAKVEGISMKSFLVSKKDTKRILSFFSLVVGMSLCDAWNHCSHLATSLNEVSIFWAMESSNSGAHQHWAFNGVR